ncbi:MAG: hypothetical protein JSV27_06080 [Candidatus Bathyarchaeota archaeon]|nr:MAG: hypothetical protein JSV27_06080 [Candidatus Bathyarchaeota archaeon]
MSGERGVRLDRDEIISVVFMALLFFVVLGGRELGSIYGSYQEVSQLSVYFKVDEEGMARYIREVLMGEDSELEVGIALTLPSVRSDTGMVTELPDYARRWFISVTLSPIVVHQPEVSEMEVALFVEGEQMQMDRFEFEREDVPYITLIDRTVMLRIDDVDAFREAVEAASVDHGGEVELTLSGRALVHLLFLETWLPFSTTSYPLVRAPHVEYISSGWTDLEGTPVTSFSLGKQVWLQFRTGNPTRLHSIHENVTATVYREDYGEPVYEAWKTASVAPGTEATYAFSFTPEEPGVYYYSLDAGDGFKLAPEESLRLRVDR